MAQQLGNRLTWEPVNTLTQFAKEPGHGSNKKHHCLEGAQLHLWQVPLTLDAQQNALALTLLNDRQREKHKRRREPAQQQAYLAGRYYLFSLLSLYTGLPIGQIELGYNRLNKPHIMNSQLDLQFNYTDTRLDLKNIGLFAFCLGANVGVDLEARARSAEFERISTKRFTAAELNYVKNTANNDTAKGDRQVDPERCLAIWTRKEAYGKAIGKGINFTMKEQNLASMDEPYELNFTDQDKRPWRLNQFEIGDDLIACVVHAGHQPMKLKAYCL